MIVFINTIIFGCNPNVLYNRLIQNQNLQELKDRKLQFFTNISHEIRTPLSLIINPLEEVIQFPELSEGARRKVRYASDNSKFLLKLVNQLLDFRKLDNSKMDLNLSKVRFNQLISQIIELHRLRAEEKNIELVFEPLDENNQELSQAVIDRINRAASRQ